MNGLSKTLTATLDPIATGGVWVSYIAFCNNDSSTHTVSVTDGTGKYFINAMTLEVTGEPVHIPLPEGGIFFAGGLKASADTAGDVDAWFTFRSN